MNKEKINSKEIIKLNQKNIICQYCNHAKFNRSSHCRICDKEEKDKKLKNEVYEERKKVNQMTEAYYNSVDLIKKQKIAELRAMNIKDKYIVPVEKYNPIKSLRKQGM